MSILALAILYVSVEYIGLSISQISLFVIILLRLTPVAQNFASQRQQIASFGMSLNNVVNILQEARQEKDVSYGDIVMDARSADINLNNVSFRYTGRDELVLNDVTLHIPAGKMIAIMGPSGAGKSTLVDLLSRFVRPTSGQITFNDTPLESFTTASLRERVAYASQVPFIFNDTVYENILYARPDATREEVLAASESAFAYEFIKMMPEGYDTMLGEGGVMLSGGQRQRLALARAFLVHPSVLILDEPTSSLDYESERKIQRAVEKMSHVQKITIIIVAHRVSTVSNADLLVILDKGRIVDVDTPAEMRKRDNWYKYAVTLEDHSENGSVTADT
jgi:ABC-type multidrug transport system fused ATPase/permease subunit